MKVSEGLEQLLLLDSSKQNTRVKRSPKGSGKRGRKGRRKNQSCRPCSSSRSSSVPIATFTRNFNGRHIMKDNQFNDYKNKHEKGKHGNLIEDISTYRYLIHISI